MILLIMIMHQRHVELLSHPFIHLCPPSISLISTASRPPSSLFQLAFSFLPSAHFSSRLPPVITILSSFCLLSIFTSCFLSSACIPPIYYSSLQFSICCHFLLSHFTSLSTPSSSFSNIHFLSSSSLPSSSHPLMSTQLSS